MIVFLSFADHDRPKGERFLGACIVEVPVADTRLAIQEAWEQGCNPGGSVLPMGFDPDDPRVPAEEVLKYRTHKNRLLSLGDLKELGFAPRKANGEPA